MTHLFIDTNVFLEYAILHEIKWNDIVEGPVRIVIPITVVNELDNLKNSERKRIRNRASAGLKLIEEVSLQKRHPLYDVFLSEPSASGFQKYDLDSTVNDDRILLTILEYSESVEDCLLVSEDTGIRLKASGKSIKAVSPPIHYKLQPVKDDQEKELERLNSENHKLKNRAPDLSLMLHDRTRVYKKRLVLEKDEFGISKKLSQLKLDYPKMIHHEDRPQNPLSGFMSSLSIFQPTKQQVESYNQKLEEYFVSYEEYLKANIENDFKFRNSVLLSIVLFNEGSTPANNVDLKISVPENIRYNIMTDGTIHEGAPDPPTKPKVRTGYQHFDDRSSINLASFESNSVVKDEPQLINSKEEFSFHYKINKVQHSIHKELHPIWLIFEDMSLLTNFGMPYRFVADNHELVEGSINVVFEE